MALTVLEQAMAETDPASPPGPDGFSCNADSVALQLLRRATTVPLRHPPPPDRVAAASQVGTAVSALTSFDADGLQLCTD